MDNASVEIKEKEHGGLYWFFYHSYFGIKKFIKNHKFVFSIGLVIILTIAFLCRAMLQPLILKIRLNLFIILMPIFLILLAYFICHKYKGLKVPTILLTVPTLIALLFFGTTFQKYIALYLQYKLIDQVEINDLPTTDFERIHPYNSIYSLAFEAMSDIESPMKPKYVRIDDTYRWTLGIEPAHPWQRFFGHISEIFNISATSTSPSFSKTHRVKVNFGTGKEMLLGHNSFISTIKTFGFWKFFNYQPDNEVLYFTDDKGEWLQVVPLIRWKGILFPRPTFGGLQIFRQRDTKKHYFLTAIFGEGKWLSAKKVYATEYLKNQNFLPLSIARYYAESFRFQQGFLAPLPWIHKGDVRIPDLPEDVNDQPFTGYFNIKYNQQKRGSIYHYFGLEPFDVDKQGLSLSLFIPADATPKVYVYKHYQKQDRFGTMTGSSAITAKVMESKKEYDWERNAPVEHRPFIKVIDGKIRFFWLTTVVTIKDLKHKKGAFISGSVPDIVLTDATYNRSIWVDPLHLENWLPQVQNELTPVWQEEEKTTLQ